MRRTITTLTGIVVVASTVGLAQDTPDVVFSTPFSPGQRPTTAKFLYNGKEIGSGREAFEEVIKRIRMLPDGTSVVWGPNYARCGTCSGREPECLPQHLYPELWDELEQVVKDRGFTLSSAYPAPSIGSTQCTRPTVYKGLTIGWSNFHGPDTLHDEVLYYVNGALLGRGDEGFEGILTRLRQASPESQVFLPWHQFGGRADLENLGIEEIKARNAKLRNVVPFVAKRREFDARLQERKLKLDFVGAGSGRAGTVLSWGAGYGSLDDIVSFGRIIHHDEPSHTAAARLAWTGYDAHETAKRQLETAAVYTVDDVEVGEGVAGFAKAMERLSTIPPGSIVQARVCLRTKGPFLCPHIYEGQRHFARTGYEPYIGMLPWLLDVARRHKLKVEWLPDEGQGIGDCQLNR
jgi:hypothetical protein